MVQTDVPPNRDVILSLRLFQPFVVVGLDLDERTEDVLILICVLVPDDSYACQLCGRVVGIQRRHSHFSKMGCRSSSPSALSASSSLALGSDLHNSSSLFSSLNPICRARMISCSVGGLTNQDKNALSSIIADHCEMSQAMSLFPVIAAHGCRQRRTTTVSLFAGMKPSVKTFFAPQL